jgi:hypothetical protein
MRILLAMDKHSSLFSPPVSEKLNLFFFAMTPVVNVIKLGQEPTLERIT